MATRLHGEAETIARALGIDGEDFVALDDNGFQIVAGYVDPLLLDALNAPTGDPGAREMTFIEKHVKFPSVELVRARCERRPLLATRLRTAITTLYGNVADYELGKAVLSSVDG